MRRGLAAARVRASPWTWLTPGFSRMLRGLCRSLLSRRNGAEVVTEEPLREKLVAEIQVTDWSELRSHAVSGRAFLVSGDLELLDVALAVANDEASAVEAWIGTGKLVRPSSAQMKSFERGSARTFRYVIVSPFVLIQARMGEGASAAGSDEAGPVAH